MSVICDQELDEFIAKFIDSPVPLDHDGVFVDITLDNVIKYEIDGCPFIGGQNIVIAGINSLSMESHDLIEGGDFYVEAGQFLMGLSQQFFRIPNDTIGTLYLRSTEARVGYQHSVALPLKRGWNGKLQLELTNGTQYHLLKLTNGMKIGQVKFERVGVGKSYEGKFSNQISITCNGSNELSDRRQTEDTLCVTTEI